MIYVVQFIGALIVAIGLLLLINPDKLKTVLYKMIDKDKLYVAAVLRVAFGVVFIMVAQETRLPNVTTGLGVFFILAGVIIPIMGKTRIAALATWWIARGNAIIRLWSVIAIALGVFIFWLGR